MGLFDSQFYNLPCNIQTDVRLTGKSLLQHNQAQLDVRPSKSFASHFRFGFVTLNDEYEMNAEFPAKGFFRSKLTI
jgi:hypothetical protein